MIAYFDTSLIVTLTLQETGWGHLSDWPADTAPTPVYSDFGWGELVSAIGLKVRRSELTADQGQRTVPEIATYLRS